MTGMAPVAFAAEVTQTISLLFRLGRQKEMSGWKPGKVLLHPHGQQHTAAHPHAAISLPSYPGKDLKLLVVPLCDATASMTCSETLCCCQKICCLHLSRSYASSYLKWVEEMSVPSSFVWTHGGEPALLRWDAHVTQMRSESLFVRLHPGTSQWLMARLQPERGPNQGWKIKKANSKKEINIPLECVSMETVPLRRWGRESLWCHVRIFWQGWSHTKKEKRGYRGRQKEGLHGEIRGWVTGGK